MPGWISPWELAILALIILLVFGPKRLPEMGRSLGKGMREFKDSISGKENEDRSTHHELTVTEKPVAAASRERDAV
jgi:sec-independent protein translocase protein TatA